MRTRSPVVCRILVVAAIAPPLGCGAPATQPPEEDVLAAVPCHPWAPSEADWSSLPTSRPASLGSFAASPRHGYMYSVASWLEGGTLKRQIVRSGDLGESWCVLPTPEPVTEVSPSRAAETTLYALALTEQATAMRLLRSTDGGASWSTPRDLPSGPGRREPPARQLETSASDPATIWLSLDPSAGGTPYVSRDGGETWNGVQLPPALTPYWDEQSPDVLRTVQEVLVDPRRVDRMLSWGTIYSVSAGSEQLRWFASDDARTSWQEVEAPPLPANTLPAEVVVDADGMVYVSGDESLIRSSNWGTTWTRAAPMPDPAAHLTSLDSREAGRLYAWNLSPGGGPENERTVWATANGGQSWTPLPVPLDPGVDPLLELSGAEIVGFSVLGISASTDGGASWTSGAIVPVPAFVQSPVDLGLWATGFVWIPTRGTMSPALKSLDGGLSWAIAGELPGPILLDRADARVLFSGNARSEDGGRTWAPFAASAGSIVAEATCPAPRSCLQRLVQTGEALERACAITKSTDRGQTWNLPQSVPADLCYGTPLLAVSPDDDGHLLAGCLPDWQPQASAVCETRDGGRTWTPHPIGGVPLRTVESIVFLPDGTALAATSTVASTPGAAPAVTSRSPDGGTTWTEVLQEGGRLVDSVARPRTVFLIGQRPIEAGSGNTSEVILRSDDSGATWSPLFPSDATASAHRDLRVWNIGDAPQGGFVASTNLGLVHFQ